MVPGLWLGEGFGLCAGLWLWPGFMPGFIPVENGELGLAAPAGLVPFIFCTGVPMPADAPPTEISFEGSQINSKSL